MWDDRKLRGNIQLEKMAKKWVGRVTWMSRMNGQVEVDRGRMVWELLARPNREYAAKVWWTGGRSACPKLESSRMIMGRRLLGESNTEVGEAVQGDLGWRKGGKEGRGEGDVW